jgi:PKHD-type hydroxylase
MFLEIPDLLSGDQVARLRALSQTTPFVDGRVSNPGSTIKNNLQADQAHPGYREAAALMQQALLGSPYFMAFAFPKAMLPPMLTRYLPGMNYGAHADAAFLPVGARPLRSDLSCTIFLNDREAYEGGELSVRLGARDIDFKPQAGGAVVYPSTTIHQVRPVTSGERLCGVTFIESLIVDQTYRDLLHQLNEVLHLEGEKMDWENRTRLTHVSSSLHRLWGAAG